MKNNYFTALVFGLVMTLTSHAFASDDASLELTAKHAVAKKVKLSASELSSMTAKVLSKKQTFTKEEDKCRSNFGYGTLIEKSIVQTCASEGETMKCFTVKMTETTEMTYQNFERETIDSSFTTFTVDSVIAN